MPVAGHTGFGKQVLSQTVIDQVVSRYRAAFRLRFGFSDPEKNRNFRIEYKFKVLFGIAVQAQCALLNDIAGNRFSRFTGEFTGKAGFR